MHLFESGLDAYHVQQDVHRLSILWLLLLILQLTQLKQAGRCQLQNKPSATLQKHFLLAVLCVLSMPYEVYLQVHLVCLGYPSLNF